MRVLVYEPNVKPTGGPSGYVYNIKVAYDALKEKLGDTELVFINNSEDTENPQPQKAQQRKMSLKKHLRKTLKTMFPMFLPHYYYYSLQKKLTGTIKKHIGNAILYDVIHFHSTFNLSAALNLKLINSETIVILTSHSPVPAHIELLDNWQTMNIRYVPKSIYNRLELLDKKAFERAYKIIFPCEEALEGYMKWEFFKTLDRNKIVFLATGTRQLEVTEERESIRKKYQIPNEAVVVTYIGRHNQIKGYDIIKQVGKEILEKYNDVHFLIGGKEEPITGLQHPRWIEIGWTNEPGNIINASDIFINANRETYFDLAVIEAISLGKPVVLSETGGNKYFKRFGSSEIYYHSPDNVETGVLALEKAIHDSRKNKGFSQQNYSIFLENFSLEVFLRRYIELLERVYYELRK